LRLFSFGGYGLALAALALVVFGDYDSYPALIISGRVSFNFCGVIDLSSGSTKCLAGREQHLADLCRIVGAIKESLPILKLN